MKKNLNQVLFCYISAYSLSVNRYIAIIIATLTTNNACTKTIDANVLLFSVLAVSFRSLAP